MAEPAVTTQVLGLSELQRGSRVLFGHIDDHASAAFQSTAAQVASLIGSKQPRVTGRLAASATSNRIDHGADVGIGDGVPYAGWIEFGGTRGRPYVSEGRTVYPTAEASKVLFERAGDKVAREQIGTMIWPKPTPKL